ncbi:MAG TPA: hypothetical protein VFX28_02745 [Methylomirabilota bacterium]|nr:hypothetical protein [Methylomirabilota bacterium]
MGRIDLTPDEVTLLREVLAAYLPDFRRQVAGTENPGLRGELNRRQGRLEQLLERLSVTPPADAARAAR